MTCRSLLFLALICLLLAPGALAFETDACPAHDEQEEVIEKPKGYDGPKENLHVYLLIGQSNMAGRAKVPEDMAGVIERCFLLNDKNEWVPAKNPLNLYSTIRKGEGSQKLGPGYSFALAMLEANPDISLGLVVNARGGSQIDQWLGKSKYYFGIRGRAKAAAKTGILKGVLWHQGESDNGAPEGYLDKLKTLIANLRSDLDNTALPFIAGQINKAPAINDQIAKLPETVHATAFVSSESLTASDRWHFDTDSQIKLGQGYAEQMLAIQKTLEKQDKPQPPKDIKFIDVHVHAHAVREDGLDKVAQWMDARGVDRCIVSPLDHKGSRAYTDDERKQMLANYAKYKGQIERMCLIEPGDFESVDAVVAQLKQEMKDGAIAMGEHYGKGLVFDDPKNLLLYEACEKVGLPIMFHIDQNKNMVEKGMQRVDNVLNKHPDCKVIAHAYWWRQLKDADRQLQEHANLYADMSGHVVVNVLNRDRKWARAFILRNQDKLLFGTDEGWWSFGKPDKQMPHYAFFEGLDLPDEVRYKLYRGNAKKLFGWDEQPKP